MQNNGGIGESTESPEVKTLLKMLLIARFLVFLLNSVKRDGVTPKLITSRVYFCGESAITQLLQSIISLFPYERESGASMKVSWTHTIRRKTFAENVLN